MFAVDTSSGVSKDAIENIKDLISNLLDTISPSTNTSRTALISFNENKPHVIVPLKDGDEKSIILKGLQQIQSTSGKTADLVNLVETIKMTFFNDEREGKGRYLIVFINSDVQDANAASKSFEDLNKAGVHVTIIDLGKNINANDVIVPKDDVITLRPDDLYSSIPFIFQGFKKSSEKGI